MVFVSGRAATSGARLNLEARGLGGGVRGQGGEKRAETERSQRRPVAERSIRWSRWFGGCVLERFCSVNIALGAAFAERLPCSIWSGDSATISCRCFTLR